MAQVADALAMALAIALRAWKVFWHTPPALCQTRPNHAPCVYRDMHIFFSVGEPSGDLHGANLIRELHRQNPDVVCEGFGGPKMQAAGCQLHADLTQLAIMWFTRVLLNLHKFWSLLRQAELRFRHQPPDAVVLIDYPGFNWWVARRAKVHGIPVFYYGAPQIWAWASWRVNKMRRLVKHVFCKLPFEEDWYRRHNCQATYIGHPYFDDMRQQKLDDGFLQRNADGRPLVAVLPGSRKQEVQTNLPWFLRTIDIVNRSVPNARFVVASFNEEQATIAREVMSKCRSQADVEVHVGRTRELIHSANCCLACSGSVSLELLHEAKPTVIHYRISRTAFQVQRLLRRVRYITLVNLLAADDPFLGGRERYDPDLCPVSQVPFPEYLTSEDRSSQMAHHLVRWLLNPDLRQQAVERLKDLRSRVVRVGALRRGAEEILRQLERPRSVIPRPHFLPRPSHAPTTANDSGSCAVARLAEQ